jgi:predicted small metal-binding protein
MAGYEMTISCRDLGKNCDFVAHGDTEEELMVNIKKHVKEMHGYTDEELNDPEMIKKIKKAIC